ncbi:MAG TPA: hypothetical protein VHT51_05415 [Micropepsaceae bacterium]|nr:hypothetical protein [Micropepsaceae bacterium]
MKFSAIPQPYKATALYIARRILASAIATSLCIVTPVQSASVKPPKWKKEIKHVMVINLENESFGDTFGPNSPAHYLNTTLLAQGELVPNWYATSHVSLGNYIAEVSGQGPTPSTNSDCINPQTLPSFLGKYFDVAPGTDAPAVFPG